MEGCDAEDCSEPELIFVGFLSGYSHLYDVTFSVGQNLAAAGTSLAFSIITDSNTPEPEPHPESQFPAVVITLIFTVNIAPAPRDILLRRLLWVILAFLLVPSEIDLRNLCCLRVAHACVFSFC